MLRPPEDGGLGRHVLTEFVKRGHFQVPTFRGARPPDILIDSRLVAGEEGRTVEEALDVIRSCRVVAILRGDDATRLATAATVLVESGVRAIEFALTTPGALDALERYCSSAPGEACVGAGTVLSATQAREAVARGARYLVTPAVVYEVISAGVDMGVPVLCGALSPTEILSAFSAGSLFVKVFPAALGGPAYLRSLRDPLAQIPLVPTGGIGIEAVPAYLAAGAVAVGIGGQLLGDAPRGGDLAQLAERARRLVRVASEADYAA